PSTNSQKREPKVFKGDCPTLNLFLAERKTRRSGVVNFNEVCICFIIHCGNWKHLRCTRKRALKNKSSCRSRAITNSTHLHHRGHYTAHFNARPHCTRRACS